MKEPKEPRNIGAFVSEQHWAELNLAIQLRGYIVVCNENREYAVGDTINIFKHAGGVTINQPLRVIALTDRADFDEQARIVWKRPNTQYRCKYYARCITD